MPVTRFAPSPTGYLHIGHVASALYASRRGEMLLRIEDIDATRCSPGFEVALIEDLAWLGIVHHGAVRRQSEHLESYARALSDLESQGLLYPCFCTRSEIKREIERSAEAQHGPDGPLYPGTCRDLPANVRREQVESGKPYALRLDVAEASRRHPCLAWTDEHQGEQLADPGRFGDVVLARKEAPVSYHLCATYDDACQGVEVVTRGLDLFESTHVHRLLQALLGLPTPLYSHHALVLDAQGRKLSKREGAETVRSLRESGVGAEEIVATASHFLAANG